MTAATLILIAVVLALGGIVGVRRAHQRLHGGIVAAAGILVADEEAQRRACGNAVHRAADDLKGVFFLPRRGDRTLRLTQAQHAADIFLINDRTGAQAIQHSTEAAP